MAKETKKTETSKPVKAQKHTSRKDREAKIKLLLTKKKYTVKEASELLPQVSLSNFAGTATLNFVLQLKEKQANESVRGSVVFPHQFEEGKRILVLCEADKVKEAEAAGADFVGLEKMVEKVEGGWMDFDVVIAQPSVMVKIAKLGKVLGPRQLMPNPKTGTVTDNLAQVIKTYKAGKVDFKMDGGKTVKIKVGKLSMKSEDLETNMHAAIDAVKNETKRLGLNVISKVIASPTMGPSLPVDLES